MIILLTVILTLMFVCQILTLGSVFTLMEKNKIEKIQ